MSSHLRTHAPIFLVKTFHCLYSDGLIIILIKKINISEFNCPLQSINFEDYSNGTAEHTLIRPGLNIRSPVVLKKLKANA